jgi:hypothetical protein
MEPAILASYEMLSTSKTVKSEKLNKERASLEVRDLPGEVPMLLTSRPANLVHT